MTTLRSMLDADFERLGITQEQFGEKLGITQQAISQWIARNRVPPIRHAQVAEILGDAAETVRSFRPPRNIVKEPTAPYLHGPSETMRTLYDILDNEVSHGTTLAAIDIGGRRYLFDYVSPRFAFQFIEPAPNGNVIGRTQQTVYKLALGKNLEEWNRTYVGVLIDPRAKKGQRKYDNLVWEARQFGIHLEIVESAEAAAHYVVSREKPYMDDDPADDFETVE